MPDIQLETTVARSLDPAVAILLASDLKRSSSFANSMVSSSLSFRSATAKDVDVLWHMLTYASSMPGDTSLAIARARSDPYLRSYVDGFGTKEGDLGVVVEHSEGLKIGAAWLRMDRGNDPFRVGDSDIPELAMGLLPNYRGQGIGTMMLNVLLMAARERYATVALSVREENPAYRLYRRLGFVETGRLTNRVGGRSISMTLVLGQSGEGFYPDNGADAFAPQRR